MTLVALGLRSRTIRIGDRAQLCKTQARGADSNAVREDQNPAARLPVRQSGDGPRAFAPGDRGSSRAGDRRREAR
jgi:hypothetical protein